ncbi:MAG: gliding motility-associated C-terminal domain-containing protein, partial [Saprospiraceae bacterium]|nr:gliding motility-associated C-terminal domain-containing protein [Saprospiraceae bacterium]
WDGKYKGSYLPSGTYFYVFDMGDQSPVQKGFLIIKR